MNIEIIVNILEIRRFKLSNSMFIYNSKWWRINDEVPTININPISWYFLNLIPLSNTNLIVKRYPIKVANRLDIADEINQFISKNLFNIKKSVISIPAPTAPTQPYFTILEW